MREFSKRVSLGQRQNLCRSNLTVGHVDLRNNRVNNVGAKYIGEMLASNTTARVLDSTCVCVCVCVYACACVCVSVCLCALELISPPHLLHVLWSSDYALGPVLE